ncbi:hypothetical protein CKALI_00525 [Corynebacterium kalinowskii]|uniref:LLM class flavin-dependent oxidoreductase n=1 Tax=Corynebacterium kalinowskii TaxID=2675216 RepID=A0A6B8VQF9_9CORY|nr:hypothetical protein [Corynebacterium kalinowskii]QGU01006.1 hypothetical protein CKALI_00525 [Corynebacterium kalinowskii]
MPIDVTPNAGLQFGIATFSLPGINIVPSCAPDPQAEMIEQAMLADAVGIDYFGVNEAFARHVLQVNPFDLVIEFAKRTKGLLFCTSISDIKFDELPDRHDDLHRVIDSTGERIEIVLDRDRFAAGKHGESNSAFNENLAEWSRLIGNCGHNVTWIEVAGQSDAIIQAASYRIPMMLQVYEGDPLERKPFVDMYHTANSRFGAGRMPLGFLAPGFVADTDQDAIDINFEPWKANFALTIPENEKYAHYLREIESGALYIGSPDTVAKKMAKTIEHLGIYRFYLRYTCGLSQHEDSLKCIRLYGEEVLPRLRRG